MSEKQRKTIAFSDRTIHYELERKNVKNINLRIRQDGTIYVSANPVVPNGYIEEFIKKKEGFILSSLKHFEEIAQYKPKPKQYISGEAFYILGHELRLTVMQGEKNNVFSDGVFLFLIVNDLSDLETKKRMVNRYYDKQCREVFSNILLEAYPQFEKYGIPYPKVRIRQMDTRWGSCSLKKGMITLNKRLIEAPQNCIEYVITHELCHFIHPNHSQQFYEFLTLFIPDWKQRKQQLDKV